MSRALVRTSAWVLVLATLEVAGTACAMQQPETPAALKRELRALLAAGRLEQAETLARRRPGDLELATAYGEVLAELGRLDEAGAAFARAIQGRAPDRMLAQARLAELEERRGRREESRRLAREVAARAEAGNHLTAEDWTAAGIAYRLLGAEDPQLFKEALRAFDHAIAADSSWLEARLRVGDLFLEKYNAPDAREAYQDLLRRDPGNARARLGLARVRRFESDAGAWDDARRSLAANPNLVPAHALLARMALDAEEYDSARAHAARAAALDSTALEAWALIGAVAALTGDSAGFREAERRAGRLTPRPADFYAEIAEAVARHRRYAEAVALARRAVALDSGSARALGTLGVNLLRTGAIDSGRAHLERAFARDPYHVWNKNTLDLLDTFTSYRSTASARFVIVADPEESELLTLYLAPLLEQAFDTLARRYGYRPPTPVRLELFRRHADFSVRTVGLTGLGALGVSFGSLLAMDSPSARDPGDFNWGSTAWHELTHAFTLGLSRHRVPRWLSEGLSVLEERRARPGWGAHATLAFLAASKAGRLHPVSRLNDGLVRPERPEEVALAYYQASLVCEYLEQQHGFETLLRMLQGYGDGLSTVQVLQRVLGLTPQELDRRFDRYLQDRFARPLAGVAARSDSSGPAGEFVALLESGQRLLDAGQTEQAAAVLQRAQAIFPEYVDAGSPARLLARLYAERGDTVKALDQVSRITRLHESDLESNRLEAELREKRGDPAGAAAALERMIYMTPFDPRTHAKLAELAARLGDHGRAVRERRALVALHPSDRADALYQLALAYARAGDRSAARREVLRVLEEAPSFEKAQALLLELRKGERQ